jgi:uncharacterized NAD(P)/FAD-binding protein YdhS
MRAANPEAIARTARRVTIVGGGLSGAATAVQLARSSSVALAITIVEPAAELGRGLAYSADDPDHRVNGTPLTHMIDPQQPDLLQKWIANTNLLARDPEAVVAGSGTFIRRMDFGRFVSDTLRDHATGLASGSTIRHCRDMAVDLLPNKAGFTVRTAGDVMLDAHLVVVATGNAAPRLPRPFAAAHVCHPAIVAQPTDMTRIRALPSDARVLLIGSGLTAFDILSTLARRKHAGPITVISRRGMRPSPQRPVQVPVPGRAMSTIMERIEGPVPDHLLGNGASPSARSLLRAVRGQIAIDLAAGGDWYGGFDGLRDVLWQVWPRMPAAERLRALRRVRPWYDAYRFRVPPQNAGVVAQAERHGRVAFRAARLLRVAADPGQREVRVEWEDPATREFRAGAYDAVINCTGLDPSMGTGTNPFLVSGLARGLLRADPTGIGVEVDAQCRPINRAGEAVDRMRVFGPPTAGSCGDPLGVVFIAAQIHRALPGMLATLTAYSG